MKLVLLDLLKQSYKIVVKLAFLVKMIHLLNDELSWATAGKTPDKIPGVKLVKKEFVTFSKLI